MGLTPAPLSHCEVRLGILWISSARIALVSNPCLEANCISYNASIIYTELTSFKDINVVNK